MGDCVACLSSVGGDSRKRRGSRVRKARNRQSTLTVGDSLVQKPMWGLTSGQTWIFDPQTFWHLGLQQILHAMIVLPTCINLQR